jgi:hypothetical protein
MAGAVHTLWFGATAEAQVVASAGAGASCAGRGQEAEKEDLPLEHFPLHLSFPKLKFEIPLTPHGDLDPHRFLGQRVASKFAKDNHTTVYEGTVVSF